jgi:hypothetical protein
MQKLCILQEPGAEKAAHTGACQAGIPVPRRELLLAMPFHHPLVQLNVVSAAKEKKNVRAQIHFYEVGKRVPVWS